MVPHHPPGQVPRQPGGAGARARSHPNPSNPSAARAPSSVRQLQGAATGTSAPVNPASRSWVAAATQAYQREQLVVPGRFDVVVTSYEMVIKVRPVHGCGETGVHTI